MSAIKQFPLKLSAQICGSLTDPQEKIVRCVEKVYPNVQRIGWGIWTDAAIFQQAGIPTDNIGPIGFGLHEPIESVNLDSVEKTADILFDAANLFFR